AIAVFVLGLNFWRNLLAHRFLSDGEQMSHLSQLMDSTTIIGNRYTTELFFPLQLRYHALHHLFPAIPYHNLAEGHRRMMKVCPTGSPYH
ncbi:MAG: fatty acid desaturase, partial [Burkholderiales bacterium]|nr:fatty acid desaturase [Burkholderiales bacterium]